MSDGWESGKRSIRAMVFDGTTRAVATVIGSVFPGLAAQYVNRRMAIRSYAAGELSGANQNWKTRPKSADADIKRGHKWILGRARDLIQNSGYVSGAIEKICNNVVRMGINPQARFRDPAGQLLKEVNKKAEALWRRWSKHADLTGHDGIAAMQKLGLRHVWGDGEFLVHRVIDPDSPPGVVPLRVELLECDHLDPRVDGKLKNGNIGRRGIEFDSMTGKPVFYHIMVNHPGDYQASGSNVSIPYPAEDIIHVFDRRRISQTRGISWLAAVLMEAYDLSEYKSTERIGARLAAAFGIFIKSAFPEVPSLGGLSGGSSSPTGGSSGAPQSGAPGWKDVPQYLEPGRIQGLPFGTEIQLASHNRPGTQYEPFIRDQTRSISAGVGMSYEGFSNDYSEASYSSARSAALEERLSYQGQQKFLNDKLNDRLWAWFVEAAWLAGLLPELRSFAADPLPYLEAVTWQDPGWTWVDPLKDGRASEIMIDPENALSTRRKLSAQRGEDWDEVVEGLIEEEKALTELHELRQKRLSKESSIQGDPA